MEKRIGKSGNLQYPGKFELHLYTQSGGGRPKNPRKAAQHQPPPAFLHYPLWRGAAVLRQRDFALRGPFSQGHRVVPYYDNQA